MELWLAIALGYIALLGLVFFEDHLAERRRQRLREEAWNLAMDPPADWRPIPGEVLTRYRTNGSADRVAEILRATALKYTDAALAHNLTVEVRELVIPQQRGPVEGRITFEVVPLPATE